MCGRYLISTEEENIEMMRIMAEIYRKYFPDESPSVPTPAPASVAASVLSQSATPAAAVVPALSQVPALSPILPQRPSQTAQRNPPAFSGGEIFPGSRIPVRIANSPQSFPVELMRWGFPFPYGSTSAKSIINARSETVHQKQMFTKLTNSNRCIIPANGFYEWKSTGTQKAKQKYRITTQNPSPYQDKTFFYMAGLFGHFSVDKPTTIKKAEGIGKVEVDVDGEGEGMRRDTLPRTEHVPCVVILTTEASAQMTEIHHRMPVMLTAESVKTWLSDTPIEEISRIGLLSPWQHPLNIQAV